MQYDNHAIPTSYTKTTVIIVMLRQYRRSDVISNPLYKGFSFIYEFLIRMILTWMDLRRI